MASRTPGANDVTAVVPGALLVAQPAMGDPNFSETVVLVLDVDDDGALGVVLNRPSPLLVAAVFEEWRDLVGEPEVLFRGGPVGTDGALALALLRDPEQAPQGFRPVLGRLGVLDLETPVDLVQPALARLRIFAGYAGWGPGQLADEVGEGAWYVVPAEPEDVFSPESDDLVREVLRRQPGAMAWHSTRPADPDLN
ncbi:YqgE/AlgH family protein [Nocardioides jishulii]|uniref:UPF0301 protein FC770_10885 n=1 Tax=Nocardioides jishulii TaxID=2575440 RepID=A0A4U2YLE9_9ACTN|nr:YqgE/AlgH family protein [Nocardioides jishulii]QCX26839.1 YqgE/AlgH family protein [Nocardioides jishulii]TKI61322.1 YqgE/AlgH family protein [Nocardioides jishulii]